MNPAGRTPCESASPPSRPARPLAPEHLRRGRPSPSGVSKWRAGVLIAIHLFAAVHIAHWWSRGETLSPLEPSEGMYTVADGAVNAGVLLLGLALLSTAILGRWFCGWACHLVALQDFCAWLLLKLGIRPRPLRSRVLLWVPLLAGLYLFTWPAILRALRGTPAPELHLALTKTGFWDTFPGWGVALFTFAVCGFGLVYFLGAKGFCTYACPYGGLFALVEPLAPFRIRVTDACKHCGHCSATCTSNVDVAREVHAYGMVVDKGCMKCGDCVSVCPEQALYFGRGAPALAKRSRARKPYARAERAYAWWEEGLLLLVFLGALILLHGLPELPSRRFAWLYDDVELYDRVPLLLALALAGLLAFASVHWLRLLRRAPAEQSFHDLRLLDASGARTRAGWIALALTSAFLLLFAHSATVQLHRFAAGRDFERTAALGNAPWEQSPGHPPTLDPELRAAVERSEAHLATAERLSLLPDVRLPKQRAWLALVRGDLDAAQRHLALAASRQPRWPNLPHERARVALLQGDFARAETFARSSQELDPAYAPAAHLLAGLALRRSDPAAAAEALRNLLRVRPDALEARAQLLTCLEFLGQDRSTEIEVLLEQLSKTPHATTPPAIRAAELLLASGAARSAAEVLDRYLGENPEDLRARELRLLAGQVLERGPR